MADSITYNTNSNTTPYGSVGQDVVKGALTGAQDWLNNNKNGYQSPYPEYTQRTGPVQMDYGVEYQQNANPYEKVDGIATNWQQFQDQMRAPVYQAHDQNLREIDQRFSGNNMYGSRGYGLHDSTLEKAGEGLMSGLLSADVNAQNQYLKNAQFESDQNLNAWKAGLTEAERQNAHNTNQFAWDYNQAQQANDFANSEASRQDAYNYDQFNWDYNQSRQPFNDYLALAGGGAPIANQAANADLQKQITAANNATSSNNASSALWGQAIGGLGGGLLSSLGGDKGLVGTIADFF